MKEKIRSLLKKRKAIMLSHNYQPPEIQDVADLCGDSLELSIKAAQTDAEVIVFCGVHFMAETASILSPDKTVLLPREDAGCLMADMIEPVGLQVMLDKLPPMPVVTYVNSTAAVKALSTICCTSANVVDVVNSLDADEILMTPDRNLALYAASLTKKKIHTWDGYCPTHDRLKPADVNHARQTYPDAVFMAHPECRPEVLELADVIRSTSGMIRYAEESKKSAFIVGTEIGLLYPLKKANPDKLFYPASSKMLCKNMKKISLEDVARSLELMEGEVKVSENIRQPAFKAVQKMIDLSLSK
ncbi:MAG: quinolinate synthase NadA [Deltaproteobacteria bacterium]|nr:quinolinate synthase NadA [Deltaproteobacteria bacterium]MBW1748538.1 quinolinate synthase NadA [Deltaproteobacteria bacterium]MBW2157193.1 quinolinate synthase NadA [Deltaproteobacteria bacterium]MBW2198051.1 quinolinate synthase NadA [Deltaproteobacteria bacterium]MBW2227761.1 quinolinate synthase NadA [Deltaproteobacteria bacterium]